MEFMNMYAYQLRLDTSSNNISFFKELLGFNKYLFGQEYKSNEKNLKKGTKGTFHLQGIVFYDKKLEKKHHDKLKKRISRVDEKYLKKSTKVYKAWSFTQGRKKVLLSYCMKDNDWVTNLEEKTLKKALKGIKEWKKNPDKSTKKKDLLEVQEKFKKKHSCPFKFNDAMIDAYFVVYNNMPRRNTQINWLYEFSTNEAFKKKIRTMVNIIDFPLMEEAEKNFYSNDINAYDAYWKSYENEVDSDPYDA